MDTEKTPQYQPGRQKSTIVIAIAISLCIFAAAYAACSGICRERKADILAISERFVTTWVKSTNESVLLWKKNLREQVSRVSKSETYSMFTAEVMAQGDKTASTINNAENAKTEDMPETLGMLVEQLSLVRGILVDFMNFNGYYDARILSPKGDVILSAQTRPTPLTQEQLETAKACMAGGTAAFSPVRASKAGLMIDMVDTITAEAEDGTTKTVGCLLVTVPVSSELTSFLTREIQPDDPAKPCIVQSRGKAWEILRASSAAPEQAAAREMGNTGLAFGPREGLQGKGTVYSYAEKVEGMDWWVVLELPEEVISSRLRTMYTTVYSMGFLVCAGILLVLALIRRILVGREQRAIAEQFERLYKQIKQQKQLLDSLNNSLEVGLVLIDTDGGIHISNPAFAEIFRKQDTELQGSSLTALFPPQTAASLLEKVRMVTKDRKSGVSEISLASEDETQEPRLFRVTLFCLEDSVGDNGLEGAVAIFQDITEFRRRSRQHARQQSNTIAALVHAIEGVDPYLAGHSQLMQKLGTVIGTQMQLEKDMQRCLDQATSLSQVGRLFVPRELLSKSGKLTPEEQAELMRIPEHANNILKYIDFGLPVTETVYEMYEKMDGSGYPRGLKGDEILLNARILAVLNAFCAMVSPRSYRAAMPIDKAIDILRSQQNVFDPHVVEMLALALYTREGRDIMAYRESASAPAAAPAPANRTDA